MDHPPVETGTGSDVLTPSYVLLTDAPPLRQGGYGCHVLAWNWLAALGRETVPLVISHRFSPGLRTSQVAADLPIPVVFYPDGCRLRLGRLPLMRTALDWLLFLLALPRLRRAVRASGARRVFALFGADAPFLLMAAWLARATGLPLDVYLVDDLEASAQARRRPRWERWMMRTLERTTLRRAARVFAISSGYVEHLEAKYGVLARWLPVVAARGVEEVTHAAFHPGEPDVRHLVFVGSVNLLYLDGLRDVLGAIAAWNAAPDAPFALRLKVLTRQAPRELEKTVGADAEHLDVVLDADDTALGQHLRSGWATFLPYSFAPEAELLVRTSFSSKFTDSLSAGRPILVYGPVEASLPRYFREAGLPLCATSPAELNAALRAIASADTPELVARYAELARRNHSPAALRTILRG